MSHTVNRKRFTDCASKEIQESRSGKSLKCRARRSLHQLSRIRGAGRLTPPGYATIRKVIFHKKDSAPCHKRHFCLHFACLRLRGDDFILEAFVIIIMVKGQKVVCINDRFGEFIRAIYLQLPVKGKTYTIREVFLGREKIVKATGTATVGILLAELVNPPDPFHAGQQELGFTSERFAPLEELPARQEEVGELAGVGAGSGFN